MDFNIPVLSISITLLSILIGSITIVISLTYGKKRSIRSVRNEVLAIGLVGLLLSTLLYASYKSANEVNNWLGVGPALLVVGSFGSIMSFYKPTL